MHMSKEFQRPRRGLLPCGGSLPSFLTPECAGHSSALELTSLAWTSLTVLPYTCKEGREDGESFSTTQLCPCLPSSDEWGHQSQPPPGRTPLPASPSKNQHRQGAQHSKCQKRTPSPRHQSCNNMTQRVPKRTPDQQHQSHLGLNKKAASQPHCRPPTAGARDRMDRASWQSVFIPPSSRVTGRCRQETLTSPPPSGCHFPLSLNTPLPASSGPEHSQLTALVLLSLLKRCWCACLIILPRMRGSEAKTASLFSPAQD